MNQLVMLRSSIIAILLLVGLVAQAQIKTPPASPKMSFTQEFGLLEVGIDYSRPSVKGRTIFGDKVPYGEVWRTGANATTKLTFSEDVKLEGNAIPKGEYALWTIPNKDEWTVIISKSQNWGTVYVKEDDFVRFNVKPAKSESLIETFTIELQDLRNESASLVLKWENTIVKVKVEAETDSKVAAQIEKVMVNPEASLAGTYYAAASYYFQTDRDIAKAVEWVNKAVEYNSNPNAYWYYRLQAEVLAKNKEYKKAIEAAKMSKEKAEKAGNMDYVRSMDKAIKEWSAMK